MSNAAAITHLLIPKPRDLGAFSVLRALPAPQCQRVGPFIFFDQFGPTVLPAGQALDVRPHPHIGLSTLTWLFAGEIQHKDSLGNDMCIRPGEVNWMTAGRGIVHSERSPASQRTGAAQLGGAQVWLALPIEKEEIEPAFYHYSAAVIPKLNESGIDCTLVAGSAFGKTSPVHTESDTFFADLRLQAQARFEFPAHIEERAVFVISGELQVVGQSVSAGQMAVLTPAQSHVLQASSNCHCLLLGGAALPGARHLYWNFVHSSRERIEQAKEDWRAGRFAKVAGDKEFIPLPE
jgi:redox-sensitive bicupin YhaK (pirin superfamily)